MLSWRVNKRAFRAGLFEENFPSYVAIMGKNSCAGDAHIRASGTAVCAVGYNDKGVGRPSTASGESNHIDGDYSIAVGFYTIALGKSSLAMGK